MACAVGRGIDSPAAHDAIKCMRCCLACLDNDTGALQAAGASCASSHCRFVWLPCPQARLPLAKMAVTETGMGLVEDKVIKVGEGDAQCVLGDSRRCLLLSCCRVSCCRASCHVLLAALSGSLVMRLTSPRCTQNHFASEFVFNKYKDLKTCDIIERDPQGEL